MVGSGPLRVRFGEFELDEANALLLRAGSAIALSPTPFGLLCALARADFEIIGLEGGTQRAFRFRSVRNILQLFEPGFFLFPTGTQEHRNADQKDKYYAIHTKESLDQ